MNEDFVPFELLCKLREKGYPCKQPRYEGHVYDVLKWLREEKKRFVVIHPEGHDVHYYYTIHNLARSFDVFEYTQSFATYEDAAIEGIEYVIDNLI